MASRRFLTILMLAVFGTANFAIPAAEETGIIEVTVTVSGSGKPLAQALVTLQGPMPTTTDSAIVRRPAEASAGTDKDGRALFKDISPGRYFIRTQKEGYMGSQQLGSFPMGTEASKNVAIGPGQLHQSISMAMMRGAAISGIITDEKGAPIAQARVSGGTFTYQNSRRRFMAAATAQADDKGNYRMCCLGPGDYYIFGEPRPQHFTDTLDVLFLLTFYPGSLDMTMAKPVKITGNLNRMGINIALKQVKGRHVKGRVLNLPDMPNRSFENTIPSFMYTPRDPNAPDLQMRTPIPNRRRSDTGEFELWGMPPGAWNIFASVSLQSPRGDGSFNAPRYISGRAAVDIQDKDIEGVAITLASGHVKGRIVMPSSPPSLPAGLSIQKLQVSLQPMENIPSYLMAGSSFYRTLGSNGEFEFTDIPLGKYSITAPNFPMLYIQDVRVGSKSISGVLDVGADPIDPVQVILAAGSFNINGTVLGITPNNTVGQLMSTLVVLAPSPPLQQNSLLYRSTQLTSINGTFYFGGLQPGEYTIYAIEGLPRGLYPDPAAFSKYEGRGRTVSLSPGQPTVQVEAPWIRKEAGKKPQGVQTPPAKK